MFCYCLYCPQKAVFSLHFDIFIYSSTMSQFITSSAPALMNNISVLIQPCCVCYIHQVAHFINACNVTDVHWCNYYHLLNKHCWLVSSMQSIEKLLMSRKFHSPSMLLSTASFTSIIASIIRQQAKGTTIAMLHFVMQHKWSSPTSFKLIRSLLQSAVRLHQQCACMSQL